MVVPPLDDTDAPDLLRTTVLGVLGELLTVIVVNGRPACVYVPSTLRRIVDGFDAALSPL